MCANYIICLVRKKICKFWWKSTNCKLSEHLLDFVQKLKLSKICYKRLGITRGECCNFLKWLKNEIITETEDFLIPLADLVEIICIFELNDRIIGQPISITAIKQILAKKCNNLILNDVSTVLSAADAEDLIEVCIVLSYFNFFFFSIYITNRKSAKFKHQQIRNHFSSK